MMSHEQTPTPHKRPRRREFVVLGFDFTDVAEEHERAARAGAGRRRCGERDAPEAAASESVTAEPFPFPNPEKV